MKVAWNATRQEADAGTDRECAVTDWCGNMELEAESSLVKTDPSGHGNTLLLCCRTMNFCSFFGTATSVVQVWNHAHRSGVLYYFVLHSAKNHLKISH